eukprot:4804839-Amphidinium_carterae.1
MKHRVNAHHSCGRMYFGRCSRNGRMHVPALQASGLGTHSTVIGNSCGVYATSCRCSPAYGRSCRAYK